MSPANNEALIALNRLWKWNGDWMTCTGCNRNLIASRDGEALGHAADCLQAEHVHPWQDLRAALGTREEAQALFDRLIASHAQIEGELLRKARALVVENKRGSISLVQRRLGIGYNHAASLLERLERMGVLSPVQGNGGRRVMPGATV